VRGDARDGPPLEDGLAHAAEVTALQVPQPAVDRLQVIERRAGAKIVALHERHPEAAQRRVPGRGQAVQAAADDQEVEPPR
jgi:hypothetical protein